MDADPNLNPEGSAFIYVAGTGSGRTLLRKRIRIQALKLSSHFDKSSTKTDSKVNFFPVFFTQETGEEQLFLSV
jgi:hypothetical protein